MQTGGWQELKSGESGQWRKTASGALLWSEGILELDRGGSCTTL